MNPLLQFLSASSSLLLGCYHIHFLVLISKPIKVKTLNECVLKYRYCLVFHNYFFKKARPGLFSSYDDGVDLSWRERECTCTYTRWVHGPSLLYSTTSHCTDTCFLIAHSITIRVGQALRQQKTIIQHDEYHTICRDPNSPPLLC